MKGLFCYDGSSGSANALSLVQTLHSLHLFSVLVNCYIYDHRKTYLPLEYQVIPIEESISEKFEGFVNVKKYVKPIQQNQSVIKEILMGYQLEKCNLLILGFYGRKGDKLHPQELTPKVRRLVYDERLPLMIVKESGRGSQEWLSVVYAYDGSLKSKQGLEELKDIVEGKNVKVTVVYVSSQDETKEPLVIRNDLREFKSRNKGRISIETKIIENSESPRESLVAYINESRPDLVVITRNGHRGQLTSKDFVGQTASLLLTESTSNIWIIK